MPRFRNPLYFISEGAKGFSRNGVNSFISVCIISFSLFLLGIFLLISRNIKGGIEKLENSIPIFIFFQEGVSDSHIREIKRRIEGNYLVGSVSYVSSEEALKQFVQDIRGYSNTFMDRQENPFPPFLEVYPKKNYVLEGDKLKKFAAELSHNHDIESVEYDSKWAIRIEALVKIWDYLVGFVGFSFFVIVAFIISNTVALSIGNHQREMDIVRWVGGSRFVMSGPFVVEGILQALLGGLFSLFFLYSFFKVFLKISSGFINILIQNNNSLAFLAPLIMVKIMLVAVGVGFLGSFISVRRLINSNSAMF